MIFRKLYQCCVTGLLWFTPPLLPLLWIATVAGRITLAPPWWLAIVITVLPYLYLILFLLYLFLFCSLRRKRFLPLMICLFLSSLIIWGGMLLPQKEQASKDSRSIHVMVWNVQRMGEYSGETNAVSQRIECVAQVIEKTKPDLLALLEISSHQLLALQTRLKISTTNCMWSDYYGTGRKRFGGLATCITGQKPNWAISRKRALNLPPNWKYLFIEVQSQHDPTLSPINFLALHIAPPNLTETQVERTVSALFKGKQGALSQALSVLKEYESQVTLQGTQALSALRLIQKFQDPTIIAGDFNSTRDAALHVSLRRELIDTWSQAGFGIGTTRYWGGFLPLRIDYIYVTKDFSAHNSQTLSEDCSDHLPVVSSIFLSPSRP